MGNGADGNGFCGMNSWGFAGHTASFQSPYTSLGQLPWQMHILTHVLAQVLNGQNSRKSHNLPPEKNVFLVVNGAVIMECKCNCFSTGMLSVL